MRASFDGSSIPKGGLTKEQMRFLSSNEAVNLVGIRMEDIGGRKQRRRSDFSAHGVGPSGSPNRPGDGQGDEEMPPPSWEQLDRERRLSEAFDRRNLAIPVERSMGIEEQAVDLGNQHEAEAGPSTSTESRADIAGADQSKTDNDATQGLGTEAESTPPRVELTTR